MSAADFLLTPTVQRLLGLVLLQPNRTFTLRELIQHAGKGVGGVQAQVEKLVRAGVLQDEPRRGRQRSIRCNPDFVLYEELRSIAYKTFAIAEPLREALNPFVSHIKQAFIFGSVAKGTDTAGSDIDLMVIGSASLLDMTARLHDLDQRLGRRIHLTMYDEDEWIEFVNNDHIVAQIASDPKVMLIPCQDPSSTTT